MTRRAPSYAGLSPASRRASAAARGSSRKRDTGCEIELRRAMWRLGLRSRLGGSGLPGRPDVVFPAARVAVFCDGDFWHGRRLDARLERLRSGHNATYWIDKIRANVARDRRVDAELDALGWLVLRRWETDIRSDPSAAAAEVAEVVRERAPRYSPRSLRAKAP